MEGQVILYYTNYHIIVFKLYINLFVTFVSPDSKISTNPDAHELILEFRLRPLIIFCSKLLYLAFFTVSRSNTVNKNFSHSYDFFFKVLRTSRFFLMPA